MGKPFQAAAELGQSCREMADLSSVVDGAAVHSFDSNAMPSTALVPLGIRACSYACING
jgi:hypothetical protein